MPSVMSDPATVQELDHHHNAIDTSLRTLPLPTPYRKQFGLFGVLRSIMASCLRRRAPQSPRLLPDHERFEAPVDILARRHTYLYIRSLSG